MSVRLGAHTGDGLVAVIREQFPVRIGRVAVVCLFVVNLGLVVSEFAGIGAAFELFQVSRTFREAPGLRRPVQDTDRDHPSVLQPSPCVQSPSCANNCWAHRDSMRTRIRIDDRGSRRRSKNKEE
jgi:hypothetical protein